MTRWWIAKQHGIVWFDLVGLTLGFLRYMYPGILDTDDAPSSGYFFPQILDLQDTYQGLFSFRFYSTLSLSDLSGRNGNEIICVYCGWVLLGVKIWDFFRLLDTYTHMIWIWILIGWTWYQNSMDYFSHILVTFAWESETCERVWWWMSMWYGHEGESHCLWDVIPNSKLLVMF